jgi:outer membrane immunogenic protein
MKRIVLAAALVALGSASALATDLPLPSLVTKAPPMVAPVANWSGFYVGGNIGYGWSSGNLDVAAAVPFLLPEEGNGTMDPASKGVVGGVQVGYVWQMGSLVTGVEADFQGSGIKGSASQSTLHPRPDSTAIDGGFRSTEERLKWFGTVRGRLGMTITPDLLVYGTGGLAYGEVSNSANTRVFDNDGSTNFPVDFPASVSKVRAGWAAGAGAEWMFASKWSARIEYLHVDLGNVSAIGNQIAATPVSFSGGLVKYTWQTRENIVRAGVNYHF